MSTQATGRMITLAVVGELGSQDEQTTFDRTAGESVVDRLKHRPGSSSGRDSQPGYALSKPSNCPNNWDHPTKLCASSSLSAHARPLVQLHRPPAEPCAGARLLTIVGVPN